MIVVEGQHSVHIAAPASLVTEDRELAWAEPYVQKNPAFAWVLGKYVTTGTANDNGHIFDLAELRDARKSVIYAPMNMLHAPHQIMGAYVANELVYPVGGVQERPAEAAAVAEMNPYLEALAVFWKYYFPNAYKAVEAAHAQGALAWSMECIPESVTCAGGCTSTFPYKGRMDDSYCEHLNQPQALKKLNRPHFTAGALVIPPARPAWRNASVTELSTFVRQELEAADVAYAQTAAEFPHLSAKEWEAIMGELLQAAGNPFKKGGDNPFKKGDDKKGGPEKKAGPHAYAGRFPGGPCKVCGKPEKSPLHGKEKADHQTDPKKHLQVVPHVYVPEKSGDGPVSDTMPCVFCGQSVQDKVHQGEYPTQINAYLDPVLAVIAAEAARRALQP